MLNRLSKYLLPSSWLLLLAGVTFAGDYYPLEPGWYWLYSNNHFQTQVVRVLDQTQVVRGVDCLVVLVRLSSDNGSFPTESVHRFYTKGAEGDVHIHGFKDLESGESFAMDPPVLILDQPLAMNMTWATRYNLHLGLDLQSPLLNRHGESFHVTETYFFDYPDGTVLSLGLVHEHWVYESDGSKVLLEPDPSIFYAEDIGVVIDSQLELINYNSFVAAEAMSWGALKSQYR